MIWDYSKPIALGDLLRYSEPGISSPNRLHKIAKTFLRDSGILEALRESLTGQE